MFRSIILWLAGILPTRTRRRRRLAATPFPGEWNQIIARNVAYDRWLTPDEQLQLRQAVQIFISEKYWEGCNGLELTDEIRVTIAAQACILTLGMEAEYFDRLLTVLVYPSDYAVDEEKRLPGGVISEGTSERHGEAWNGGPVVLSWPSVLHGGKIANDGENLVFHEFAHVLDMANWDADGVPELSTSDELESWQQIMASEYERLVRAAEAGRPTLLNKYGTTNAAEFFAVSTECFFERGAALEEQHPRLYKVLRNYFRQDPARRRPRLAPRDEFKP